MWSRRAFLRIGSGVGTAAVATAAFKDVNAIQAASAAQAGRAAEDVAQDEFYWREIQEAFTLDRTLTNLNNGNTCPSPRVVHEACKRYMDMANMLPVQYNGMIGRNIQTVRRRLAAEFGCDVEELALTRNASESLQIAQNGIDLKPGDEVLTTEQDYPRMLTTWDQRVRRDKIKVTRIQFPVPTTQDDLYQRFEQAITPQTKVLHFCHITNLTGQLFPGAAAQPARALARHRHDRRRRARARALPVQAARSRVRLLRRQPAQVAAGADRQRAAVRAPREHREDLAAAGGPGSAGRTTSRSSSRSGRTRRRFARRWPRRWRSIRRSAPSARRRGCAT